MQFAYCTLKQWCWLCLTKENCFALLSRQHTRRQLTRHQAVFDAKACRILSAHSWVVCYTLRQETASNRFDVLAAKKRVLSQGVAHQAARHVFLVQKPLDAT
jgi:hypothetical protein